MTLAPGEPVDLTNCDREPIHIPGSIQPHGCLLACDPGLTVIRRISANAPAMLGVEHGDLNASALDRALGPRAVHDIRNALARSSDPARPGLLLGYALREGGPVFDIAVHAHDGVAIIEFEPAPREPTGSPLEIVRALISRLRGLSDVDRLSQAAARLLRGLLGYDRVMIYRFDADGSGKVISEAKRSGLESFLGQHFPASDIPLQARRLYVQNTLRVISDAACARVPIIPEIDAEGAPLDLSFAHLRSVSPIHCEYLRNMGVGASMSISILEGDRLWGLIACHHYERRALPMAQRVAAEMFGEFFTLHLGAVNSRRKLEMATQARRSLDDILRRISHHAGVSDFLQSRIGDFMQLMPCDGVGLWVDGAWSSRGAAPPGALAPALAALAAGGDERAIWSTDELSGVLPEAGPFHAEASGALAVPLSQLPRDYLFFFRKEVIQTIDWGGDPEKRYVSGPLGDRLTPRTSFAIWKQTVERRAAPWTDADLEIAEATRAALAETVLRQTELLADERSKSEIRQKILNEELNHRVKNILSLIKSLVSYPAESGLALEAYVNALRGRVQALAFAHDQVVRGGEGGALRDLLHAELSPYRSAGEIGLAGPIVGLDARAYSVMALILHELATNAAKYGPFAARPGRLDVVWSLTPDGDCELTWTESGGPPVAPPTRRGFGSVLMERSVPYDLGGEAEIDYRPSGVRARFLIPARYVVSVADRQPDPDAAPAEAADASGALTGLKLLVLEDQLLIALEVETMLAECGVAAVETASSVAEAERRGARFAPDAAVLDVNLGPDTSFAFAARLAEKGVPFVFATGYGDPRAIPPAFAGVPVVRKPYDRAGLAEALARAIARAGRS